MGTTHGRGWKPPTTLRYPHLAFCQSAPNFPLTRGDIIKSRSKRHFEFEYELKEQVGSGAFGSVYICVHSETGQVRACKIIPKASVIDLKLFLNEVKVCIQLDHPNIIRLIQYYEGEDQVHLVFRLCNGMDLFDKICELIETKGHFSVSEAAWAMRHMVKAIIGCHSKNIAHMDVKPENFMITDGEKEKNHGLTHSGLRLIDMGLSQHLRGGGTKHERGDGTIFYMAPEVIRGHYDQRCDIWSLGVILYLMLVGEPLFPITDSPEEEKAVERSILTPLYVKEKLKDITKYNYPWISTDAKDLISRMLDSNPHKRISLVDAMKHPFLERFSKSGTTKSSLGGNVEDSLRKFCTYPALKRAALQILAHLTPDTHTKVERRTFRTIDTNYNGELSLDELVAYLKHKSGRELSDDFSEIFDVVSLGSESISLCAFLAATLPESCCKSAYIKQVFQILDSDGDGYISCEDLSVLVENRIEPDELKSVIDEVSPGPIKFDAFENIMVT